VVGTAFAVLLEEKGFECIGINTRSKASYDRFNTYLQRKYLDLDELSREADLIFITTQDGVIEKVAEQLTYQNRRKTEQYWIHCSGSLRSEIMCKDPTLPVHYLSVHPLQAFANVDNALKQMAGTHFGIEGNTRKSEELGENLVKRLGGIPHKIDPAQRPYIMPEPLWPPITWYRSLLLL
jgi:predicted short-subunit dehydrogenase-like oxidoreductase (DUF2520 family)